MTAHAIVDACVIADVNERYCGRWLEVADIIVCGHEWLPLPAPQWISQILATYPGAALALVEDGNGGSVLGLRDGRLVSVSAGGRPFAAFLHYWLAVGNPVEALDGAIVCAGRRSFRLRVGLGRWEGCQ